MSYKKSAPSKEATPKSSSVADPAAKSTAGKTSTPTTTVVDNLVTELRPHDVIMGRGLSASEYQGNKRLRKMVQARRQDYVSAESRDAKQNVAREIIAAVRAQGGRFLRRYVAFGVSSTQSVWQSIQDPEEMMTKVKQLLRDTAPEVKERRVQRRRRQAEWARQNAHTNLFPAVQQNPFGEGGGSSGTNNNNDETSSTARKSVPPAASVREQSSVVPPSVAASLNTRTAPQTLVPAALSAAAASALDSFTSSSNVMQVPTNLWKNKPTTDNTSSTAAFGGSSLTIGDMQRLLIRQQQEQDQQRLRLLQSLSSPTASAGAASTSLTSAMATTALM